MTPENLAILTDLSQRAGIDKAANDFKRYGSARQLYNFDIDKADEY